MSAWAWLGVAVVGGAGAASRFAIDGLLDARVPSGLPLGTFAINISGSLLLGLFTGLGLSGEALLLAGTAALGSYTTFSTWMFESQRLAEEANLPGAALNLLASLALGVAGAAIGRTIGAHL